VLCVDPMTLKINFSISAILAASLLVAGCAGSGDRYPSLAQRDAERVYGTLGVAPSTDAETTPDEPIAPDPDHSKRLAALVQQASKAHAQFIAKIEPVENALALAQGTTDDDNAWAEAQIAMADLDSHRSASAIALGDLDLLHANASVEFAQKDQIANAQQQVITLLDQEDRELARLRQLLP